MNSVILLIVRFSMRDMNCITTEEQIIRLQPITALAIPAFTLIAFSARDMHIGYTKLNPIITPPIAMIMKAMLLFEKITNKVLHVIIQKNPIFANMS